MKIALTQIAPRAFNKRWYLETLLEEDGTFRKEDMGTVTKIVQKLYSQGSNVSILRLFPYILLPGK